MTPDIPKPTVPRWIAVVLALLAVVAIAGPLAIVTTAPKLPPVARAVATRPQRVVPPTELPSVEPAAFIALAPTDARAFNATVPFSTDPNPAARPFRLTGSPESQARAIDCLAAAAIYEAGDDTNGQKAVVQVVLNRVRHPAFPKTVCGVVFQGQERRTGCQFTFTCDGAMLRAVYPAAWERARTVARMALGGTVDARVGHATHYHTDWVVPYWSSSLDKIVAIDTHLFFRWSGWWGTPGAFRGGYTGVEPVIPQLARLSEAHRSAAESAGMATAQFDPSMLSDVEAPTGLGQDTNTFLVTLNPRLAPEQFSALAENACGVRPYCKFMAWSAKAGTPAALPITPIQQRAMAFSYLRDRASGFEKALWNCTEFKRAAPNECMKAQVSMTMAAPPPPPAADPPAATAGRPPAGAAPAAAVAKPAVPDPLAGVRRKGDAPAATAAPATSAPPPVRATLPRAEPAREP